MSAGKGRMITDWVAWTKRVEAREVSVRSMVKLVLLMSWLRSGLMLTIEMSEQWRCDAGYGCWRRCWWCGVMMLMLMKKRRWRRK